MIKRLFLCRCGGIGSTYKIFCFGIKNGVSVILKVFKIVFYPICGICVRFPLSGVGYVLGYGKGKDKAVRHLCFTLKPAEEGITGIGSCRKGELFLITADCTCIYTSSLSVINVGRYRVSISGVVNLKNKTSVTVYISACRLVICKVFKCLYLCICCRIGSTYKIFCFGIKNSISVILNILEIVFYLVRSIGIRFPNCICNYVLCYRSGKIKIPALKRISKT